MINNCYSLNLEVLRLREPDLANRLEEAEIISKDDFIKISNLSQLELNLDLRFVNTLIVLGLTNPLHIKKLLQNTPLKTFILLIEKDINFFKTLLNFYDIRDLISNSRLSLSINEDPDIAIKFRLDRFYGINTVPDIIIAEDKISTSRYPQFYEKVKSCIKEAAVVAMQNLATLAECSQIWQEQILQNLDFILKKAIPAKVLYAKFKKIPGIIVSAGPSLDKNIDQLNYAKNKAVIICVDTAWRSLYKENILPDFIMSIDASRRNWELYIKDLPSNNINLVCGPAVYPKTLVSFDRVFMLGFGHPLFSCFIEPILGRFGEAVFGGSVATTAFDFLRRLGNDPIIFVGQDLSFPDDKIYTEGVDKNWQEEVRKKIEKMPVMWVDGIDGGKVRTTPNMWAWLKWFEFQIKNTPDVCFIDATEGGARIDGTKIMRLKDVVSNICVEDIDISGIINSAMNDFTIDSSKKTILRNSIGILVDNYKNFKKYAREGINLSNKLIKLLEEKKKIYKQLRQLNKLYNQMITNKEFMLLHSWSLEYLLYKIEKSQSQDTSLLNKIKTTQEFFKEIYKLLDTSINLFSNCYNKLI